MSSLMLWLVRRHQRDEDRLHRPTALAALTAGDLTGSLLQVVGTVQQCVDKMRHGRDSIVATNKENLDASGSTAGIAYDAGVPAGESSQSITVASAAKD